MSGYPKVTSPDLSPRSHLQFVPFFLLTVALVSLFSGLFMLKPQGLWDQMADFFRGKLDMRPGTNKVTFRLSWLLRTWATSSPGFSQMAHSHLSLRLALPKSSQICVLNLTKPSGMLILILLVAISYNQAFTSGPLFNLATSTRSLTLQGNWVNFRSSPVDIVFLKIEFLNKDLVNQESSNSLYPTIGG